MTKPRGTTGETKMKILAIVCHDCERGRHPYGYGIWQSLKGNFHIYLDVNDVRNVYHHLKELQSIGALVREEGTESGSNKYVYRLTEAGMDLRHRFEPYMSIVRRDVVS